MELILDRNDGVPFAFRLLADGATLRGEDFGRKIPATVCQKAPWKSLSLESSPTDLTTTSDAVEFHFVTNSGNTRAASFTLRYELLRTTLTITLEDVKEFPGYELISVELPRLVTVREEDSP
jgi:hypothetical protein